MPPAWQPDGVQQQAHLGLGTELVCELVDLPFAQFLRGWEAIGGRRLAGIAAAPVAHSNIIAPRFIVTRRPAVPARGGRRPRRGGGRGGSQRGCGGAVASGCSRSRARRSRLSSAGLNQQPGAGRSASTSALDAVMDAYSRRIIGWSIAHHIRTELVLDALGMAILRRRPPEKQTILHSDHGTQSSSTRSSTTTSTSAGPTRSAWSSTAA